MMAKSTRAHTLIAHSASPFPSPAPGLTTSGTRRRPSSARSTPGRGLPVMGCRGTHDSPARRTNGAGRRRFDGDSHRGEPRFSDAAEAGARAAARAAQLARTRRKLARAAAFLPSKQAEGRTCEVIDIVVDNFKWTLCLPIHSGRRNSLYVNLAARKARVCAAV